jgi:polyhydroxyalkanoate synthesis regulator phasin
LFFFRYFHVNLGAAQKNIEELIKNGKWNINEFPEMKQDLLNKLKIQQKSEGDYLM